MKHFVFSVAAIAMVAASPALAAPIARSAGDGTGTYEITGKAGSFCQLGPVAANSQGGASRNVTVDYTTPNSSGNSGGTSDAMIGITQLQDVNDHAEAWKAVINMHHSVCNSAYTVTANSSNGGLQYQGQENGGSDFTKKLAYTVQAEFGDKTGPAKTAKSLQNGGTLLTSKRASSGDFRLTFDGAAERSQYLLAGDYTDTVVVNLAPDMGNPA